MSSGIDAREHPYTQSNIDNTFDYVKREFDKCKRHIEDETARKVTLFLLNVRLYNPGADVYDIVYGLVQPFSPGIIDLSNVS